MQPPEDHRWLYRASQRDPHFFSLSNKEFIFLSREAARSLDKTLYVLPSESRSLTLPSYCSVQYNRCTALVNVEKEDIVQFSEGTQGTLRLRGQFGRWRVSSQENPSHALACAYRGVIGEPGEAAFQRYNNTGDGDTRRSRCEVQALLDNSEV